MNKPIDFDDFEQICMVNHVQYDALNHRGYFMVKKADLSSNSYLITLYQVDLKTKEVKKLLIKGNPYTYLLAEGKLLLIYATPEGSKIVLYHPETEKETSQCTMDYKIESGYFHKGKVLFKAPLKRGHKKDEIQCYKQVGIQKTHHLYTLDLKTSCVKRVSPCKVDVDQIAFNPKKECIVYTGFKLEKIKPLYSDVYTYALSSGETEKWTDGTYRINQIGCHEKKVLFTGVELDGHSRNDNQDTYAILMDTGEIKPLTLFRDKSLESLGVMGDSHTKTGSRFRLMEDRAYYITIDRFGETLRSICVNGFEKAYNTGLKTIDSFAVCREGVLLAGVTTERLHEVYWVEKDQVVKLTELNQWMAHRTMQMPIYHNEHVDGWVIPPAKRIDTKKYPGILMIHGGPKAIYADVYSHDMQLLSQAGFYVFFCNPRGSDGRGDAFANIRGHYGDWAFEDLMKWTDKVLALYPDLDPESLGVMGGSYGGYMTNYIITHTERFKAAISARGISSMITGFLASDIGYEYVFEYMGNEEHPWSDHNRYDEASPLNYAHKVKTPTLFMHGKEDVRCPYQESIQMYSALVYLGVETDIVLFDEEGHGYEVVGKPKSKQVRYQTMLDWFLKYLQ